MNFGEPLQNIPWIDLTNDTCNEGRNNDHPRTKQNGTPDRFTHNGQTN